LHCFWARARFLASLGMTGIFKAEIFISGKYNIPNITSVYYETS
jgi:hypothetical protein